MPTSKTQDGAPARSGRFWQPPDRRDNVSEEGRKWLEENAEAIRSWNAWAEENELPLAKYRTF